MLTIFVGWSLSTVPMNLLVPKVRDRPPLKTKYKCLPDLSGSACACHKLVYGQGLLEKRRLQERRINSERFWGEASLIRNLWQNP